MEELNVKTVPPEAQKSAGSRGKHDGPPASRPNLPAPMRFICLLFATGLGTGFSPFASGTVGSLVGVGLFALMAPAGGAWTAYILATLVFIWLAIHVSTAAEGIYGKKDDGRVVIDEIVGYLVTMFAAPLSWPAVIAGFVLFRFFDVVKPWPARQIQNLPGGFGIVLDDLVAGVYACIALHVFLLIL